MGPDPDGGGSQLVEPQRKRRLFARRIQSYGRLNFRACEAREGFFPSIVPCLQQARIPGQILRLAMKTSGRGQAGKPRIVSSEDRL